MFQPILLLFLFLLLLLLRPSIATITPEHFAGTYTVQHGNCPQDLSILVNATTLPPAVITASNATCTGDDVVLAKGKKGSASSAFLSFLLSSAVGDFYTSSINLSCGSASFTGPVFLLRPEGSLTLPPAALAVFPGLNASLPNGVALSEDFIYIFVDSCVYRRDAPEDTGIVEHVINTISECFPADAMVHTSEGRTRMESLQVGDSVLSMRGVHTRVIAWTHRDSVSRTRFIEVSWGNASIAVTPGHYVYADGETIPARLVKPGMVLPGLAGDLVVRDVRMVWKTGVYNPQTGSGDIVVDGVVVSTYTEAIPPIVAHALLAPVRVGYDLFSSAETDSVY